MISEQAVAIYHPQDGTLTISGDAEINGPSAIQMKSGDLTITGGTITATGPPFVETPDADDTTSGAEALATRSSLLAKMATQMF